VRDFGVMIFFDNTLTS